MPQNGYPRFAGRPPRHEGDDEDFLQEIVRIIIEGVIADFQRLLASQSRRRTWRRIFRSRGQELMAYAEALK